MPRGGGQFIRLSSELTLDSLVTTLCANAQLLPSLQATRAQYIATIGRSHALAKAMAAEAADVVGLVGALHDVNPSKGAGQNHKTLRPSRL